MPTRDLSPEFFASSGASWISTGASESVYGHALYVYKSAFPKGVLVVLACRDVEAGRKHATQLGVLRVQG